MFYQLIATSSSSSTVSSSCSSGLYSSVLDSFTGENGCGWHRYTHDQVDDNLWAHIAIVLCDSGSECHSTESSYVFRQNWDKRSASSIYPTISCEAVLNPKRLNPPCLNPSYLTSRLLRVIRCGVCSVFCFFVGSLTSTLT